MYSSSTPSVYGSPLAEAVVEHASALGESGALAGDRRRERLLHAISASASISTRQRESIRLVTTYVQAGRTSRKTAPWARAIS